MSGEDRYVNRKNYVDGDPKPPGAFIGQELLATNGNAWEWSGTGWFQTKVGGTPIANDISTEISLGNVDGHEVIEIIGHNDAVGTSSETLWIDGDLYTFPSSASTMTFSSADVNDTGTLLSSGTATGGSTTTLIDTGATFVSDGGAVGDAAVNDTKSAHGIVSAVTETQITVHSMSDGVTNESGNTYRIVNANSTGLGLVKGKFLNTSYVEFTEYIILNGQNGVSSTGSIFRINGYIGVIAGSSGFNEGICYIGTGTITAGKPANVFGAMEADSNKAHGGFFTVPSGKTLLFKQHRISVESGKFVEISNFMREVGGIFLEQEEFDISGSLIPFNTEYFEPLKEKTDYEMRAVNSTGGGGDAKVKHIIIGVLVEN